MADWIVRHAWAVLLGALLATLISGLALPGIGFDDDVTRLWSDAGPDLAFFEQFEHVFGSSETTLAVVARSKDPIDRRLIGAVQTASDRIAGIDGIDRVMSLTRTDVPQTVGDTVVVAPLFGKDAGLKRPIAEEVARLRHSGPLGRRLLSDDGRTVLIAAQPRATLKSNAQIRPIAKKVRAVAEQAFRPLGERVEVRFAGIPFTRLAAMKIMWRDLLVLTPLTSALVFLVVLLAFGDLRAALVGLVPAAVINTLLLALIHRTGHQLNLLTAVLPALMTVMAVTDGIHLISRYREGIGGHGTPSERASNALRHTGKACLLTSFTTMVGFGSLALTHVTILRQFGAFAAAGMAIAFVVVLCTVPAGLVALRVRGHEPTHARPRVQAYARWVTAGRKPLVLAVGGLLLFAGAAWMDRHVTLDSYLIDALRADDPVSRGNHILDDQLGGMMPVEVSLQGKSDAFRDPSNLARLARLEKRIEHQQGARFAVSLADVVEQIHEAFGGGHTIPGDHATIAQLLSLAEPRDLRAVVTPDFARARLLFYTHDGGARYLSGLSAPVTREAKALFRGTGVQARVTGISQIASNGITKLASELMEGLALSVVVIVGGIGLVFRSARLAMLSLLPNLLPLALACLWYTARGKYIDPVSAISFAVALGMAVDDTIHLAARYLEERRAGRHPGDAIRETLVRTFGPIVLTSVALSAGFASLVFSNFPATGDFGALVSAALMLALVADLLVTPSLLQLMDPRPGHPSAVAVAALATPATSAASRRRTP